MLVKRGVVHGLNSPSLWGCQGPTSQHLPFLYMQFPVELRIFQWLQLAIQNTRCQNDIHLVLMAQVLNWKKVRLGPNICLSGSKGGRTLHPLQSDCFSMSGRTFVVGFVLDFDVIFTRSSALESSEWDEEFDISWFRLPDNFLNSFLAEFTRLVWSDSGFDVEGISLKRFTRTSVSTNTQLIFLCYKADALN